MTGLRALADEHARCCVEIERGCSNVDDAIIARQAQVYAQLIKHPAATTEDITIKLRAICAYYAGGEAPVSELDEITEELERLLST